MVDRRSTRHFACTVHHLIDWTPSTTITHPLISTNIWSKRCWCGHKLINLKDDSRGKNISMSKEQLNVHQLYSAVQCYTRYIINFFHNIHSTTKRSAVTKAHTSIETMPTAVQLYDKLHLQSFTCDWLWRSLKVIRNCTFHFILVVCSSNVSIVHHAWDTATFTSYMTASDLEKSFSFDTTVDNTGHYVSVFYCFQDIMNYLPKFKDVFTVFTETTNE